MSDFSIGTIPAKVVDPTAAADAGISTGTTTADFKQLLTALILGMTMSGQSDESSFFSSQMAPVILGLIETLMAQEEDKPEEATAQWNLQLNTQPNGMPISGGRLTQTYHSGHQALDFGIPVGTPVRATMSGKVAFAGWNHEGYGNLVIVENGPYRTFYAHLSEIPVRVGQSVPAGTVVGLSGNTGNSTGPHLHYEVRFNGRAIDPRGFTLPGS